MQNIPTWLFFWQWINAILGIGAKAAVALPVITALTLFTGRRGNARLCAFGARSLTKLNLVLAVLGPLLVAAGVLALLAGLRGAEHMLDGLSFWMPAMRPYAAAILAWIAGLFCLLLYLAIDRKTALPAPASGQERWQPGQIGLRAAFSLLAALCFFAAQTLPNWPFSALPQGLSMKDAALAVLSSSTHEYFTAFAPAGSIALLVLALNQRIAGSGKLGPDDEQKAARWCALWAMIGYIPRCIDQWGMVIGFSLRQGPLPQGIASQALALVPVTIAILCWVALFVRRAPRQLYWLNTTAFLLLILGASLPFLTMLAR